MTPHGRYEQLWRELELCDTLGFDYGFCVEHHFTPHESWMSSPSAEIDWARDTDTWQGNIIRAGKIATQRAPVRVAVEKVRRLIGLLPKHSLDAEIASMDTNTPMQSQSITGGENRNIVV
jgi:hypothetical protein